MRKIEGRDAELERLAPGNRRRGRAEVQRIGDALHELVARSKAAPKLAESIRAQPARSRFPPIRIRSETDRSSPKAERARPGSMPWSCFFFAESRRAFEAFTANRLQRRNLAPDARDTSPRSQRRMRFRCWFAFDEIDANVGGEIANAVGAKMRKLAADHQVLCITHLPQVAAAATTQFVVTKESQCRVGRIPVLHRSDEQSAARRDRAHARRKKRIRHAARGDLAKSAVRAVRAPGLG